MRRSPLDLTPDEFRSLGHSLIDTMADLLAEMPTGPVTQGADVHDVRAALGNAPVPETGSDARVILYDAVRLLRAHNLYNGHPRFFGFITASAAPIGAFADFIASTINQNLGGHLLSPMATEIEAQTVRWIAQLLGMPDGSGGVLVSGGNMANMVGMWAARAAMLGEDVRREGVAPGPQPCIYASAATHTWVQKWADLCGIGTDGIRSIPADARERIEPDALRATIQRDIAAGDRPIAVIGTAGSVSTGAIDPLRQLHAIAREFGLWFHVDGAYGAPAAILPDASDDLRALSLADSVAVDPHKWLYAPIEAGCALVRDPKTLFGAFRYHPPYYPEMDDDPDAPIYFYDWSPQNTRGFRALKVWLALRQVGRTGYQHMIAEDIRLARLMYDLACAHPELEAATHALSITTFRYVGAGAGDRTALNELNKQIMERVQSRGRAFLTNAVLDGTWLLRACIVNFRTGEEDVRALIDEVVEVGREVANRS